MKTKLETAVPDKTDIPTVLKRGFSTTDVKSMWINAHSCDPTSRCYATREEVSKLCERQPPSSPPTVHEFAKSPPPPGSSYVGSSGGGGGGGGGIVVLVLILLICGGGGGLYYYGTKNPESKIGQRIPAKYKWDVLGPKVKELSKKASAKVRHFPSLDFTSRQPRSNR